MKACPRSEWLPANPPSAMREIFEVDATECVHQVPLRDYGCPWCVSNTTRPRRTLWQRLRRR